MDNNFLLRGYVVVRHNGKIVAEGHNLVVNAGLTLLASLLTGSGIIPGYMAVGSSSTAPAGADTSLKGTEHARVAVTKSAADNSVTYEADFTGENVSTLSVQEFGILNAASAGILFCRFICQEITWAAGDTLQVSWTIGIGETT